MKTLANYTVTQVLSEGKVTSLYRGYHKKDKSTVLIKKLNEEAMSELLVERFKAECDLSQRLQGGGTPRVLEVIAEEDTYALVLEDRGYELLKDLAVNKRLTVVEFLKVAIGIVNALEELHQHRLIHRDLNPGSILWSGTVGEARLIDLEMASSLLHEGADSRHLQNQGKGDLRYISPEQTGRLNRGMDYRSDYYSLGIVFYQVATGVLPFQSSDLGELVHFHIAKLPISPREVNPELPAAVSNIIMKLLAKTPEERYQSTYGLKQDLKYCLDQLSNRHRLGNYTLGSQDVSALFKLSEKLYDREDELKLLLNAFDKASQSRARLLLLTGGVGIGKSALIEELYKPLVEERGYFIVGRFEQLNQNIPYLALTQAFQGLVEQILMESEEEIRGWRERIQAALGANAQVIVEVIPLLTAIIGPQPPVASLDPAGTQNRFNLEFQDFIHALATEEKPLAIFLDDMQWATAPALKLLETLLLYAESQHFLVIGAYRETEVPAGHGLLGLIENLKKANFYYSTIALRPLEKKYILMLLQDTLQEETDNLQHLAEICQEKTEGNPFFLNQFLQTLYQEGLIDFSHREGRWLWQEEAIAQKSITTNVIELMVKKIEQLSYSTQEILKIASCIGSHFNLSLLSSVSRRSQEQVKEDIWEAIEEGVLLVQEEAHVFVEQERDTSYQFLHERIQQAAYTLVSDEERKQIHLSIGKELWRSTPQELLPEKVLEIVNHLNVANDLIIDAEERVKIAELNLLAGKKAKTSIAYQLALEYLKAGMSYLPSDHWQYEYRLSLALYTDAVECAYITTNFEEMEKYSEIVIAQGKNLLDKIRIYEIRIFYLATKVAYSEALNLIRTLLKMIGINLPEHPSMLSVVWFLIRTKLALRGKSINELYHLPEMTDTRWQAALRILRSSAAASYIANQNFFLLSVLQSVILLAKYGNAPQAARSYISYAHILCGALNEIERGYQFGQLALQLFNKYKAENIIAQVWMVHGAFVMHYREHMEDAGKMLVNAINKGLETGDLEFAGYAMGAYVGAIAISCRDFASFRVEAERLANKTLSLKQKTPYQWIVNCLQGMINLAEDREEYDDYKITLYDEKTVLQELLEKKENMGLFTLYYFKFSYFFFVKNYEKAYKLAEEGVKFLKKVVGVCLTGSYYFLQALNSLGLSETANHKKNAYIKVAKKCLKKLKNLAKFSPMNNLHKCYLVEAKLAQVQDNFSKAAELYDKAIELARENRYLIEEALANELAAELYLSNGSLKAGKAYLNEAYHCYSKWGLTVKVKLLEKHYSHLLDTTSLAKNRNNKLLTSQNTVALQSVDSNLTTILKASQTMSRIIDLDALLQEIISIVKANTEAEKIYIVLENFDKWQIKATNVKADENFSERQPLSAYLATGVLEHVINTKQALLVKDASHDDQFAADEYIQQCQPKSILCLPLLNQNTLSGILYLENDTKTQAFSQYSLELLNFLSGQMAIAIENAKLYTHSKELTEAYKRFIPHEFLQLLNKPSITDIQLGDQIQKEMTVMFCDIRGFTTLSEKMLPQDSMSFLNEYLSYLEPVISKHHGFIDKYIGDAIMALFASPDDALHCAIEMLQALDQFNKDHQLSTPLRIGIGLNSGLLTLCTVGVASRMQETVVSDVVNVAARVEHLTKSYRVPLLITEETYSRLKLTAPYQINKCDVVQINGKSQLVSIYQVAAQS